MSEVQFVWNGLTLGGDPFRINQLTGWLELPDVAWETTLAAGHGMSPSPGVFAPRVVQIGGFINAADAGSRNAAIAAMNAATIPRASWDASLDPLVGTVAGVTWTADAQLARRAPATERATWHAPVVPWLLQFRCPDPRFYSSWMSETAPLLVASSGTVLPHTLPFSMPDKALGGQVSLTNPGNDPEGSPLRVTLTGGQGGTVGVEVSKPSGAVVVCTWPLTLAADRGDGLPNTLEIDTERGGAFLDGYAYRATTPGGRVSALRLEPGVNVVRALGTAGAGSPSILAAVRPRSW